MNITDLVEQAHRIAVEHGFWDGSSVLEDSPDSFVAFEIAAKLALIHAEVSEALEVLRQCGSMEKILIEGGARFDFAEELADVVIRVADLCGAIGIDLDNAIIIMMMINKTRPPKHGKAF